MNASLCRMPQRDCHPVRPVSMSCPALQTRCLRPHPTCVGYPRLEDGTGAERAAERSRRDVSRETYFSAGMVSHVKHGPGTGAIQMFADRSGLLSAILPPCAAGRHTAHLYGQFTTVDRVPSRFQFWLELRVQASVLWTAAVRVPSWMHARILFFGSRGLGAWDYSVWTVSGDS